jgi:hypothetical protein
MTKQRTTAEVMKDRECTAIEAEATLARESAEADEATISINGGPTVPVSVAMAALDVVREKKEVPIAKPITENRRLMCKLTPEEQRARGVELADTQHEITQATEEKRQVGERIKEAQAKIDRLTQTVKHCQEEREVTCLLTPDYDADTMTFTRTDNGEIVYVRQLSYNERQPELPGTEVPEDAGEQDNEGAGEEASAE